MSQKRTIHSWCIIHKSTMNIYPGADATDGRGYDAAQAPGGFMDLRIYASKHRAQATVDAINPGFEVRPCVVIIDPVRGNRGQRRNHGKG